MLTWHIPQRYYLLVTTANQNLPTRAVRRVYLLGRLKSSAFSRRLRIKRPELRGNLGSLAFRTFDLLLIVLGNAHGDCETLVALFAKIFVKGHRGILSIRREYNGLENLNTVECAGKACKEYSYAKAVRRGQEFYRLLQHPSAGMAK